jgi:hypothetical protein
LSWDVVGWLVAELGVCFLMLTALPLWTTDGGVLSRSELVAFSADSASLIFAFSLRAPALCLCCATSSLASAAYFCLSCLRGSGICLSMVGTFSLPLVGGGGFLPWWIGASTPDWFGVVRLLFPTIPLRML